MKKLLKSILQNYLLKRRFLLQKATEKKEVLDFIKKLHPIKTQVELIRLGPNTDGGYLLPNDLVGIEACFSPGVDTVSDFELDCLERGMKIFMADKSVDKPNLSISPERYSFIKKFIGSSNNDEYITMDDWVKENYQTEDCELLLQMDIEGSEYVSFINMSDSLQRKFRIMVVEFHSLHKLWDPTFFYFSKEVFDKILETHYCVHIHPNNCCKIHTDFGVEIPQVAEFTFLRKDRVSHEEFHTVFPHPLDHQNSDSNAPITLPKIWHSGN